MDWSQIDWEAVQRLRSRFLGGEVGGADYWLGPNDLVTYDQTFGRRIAWKWNFVLGELRARGWSPPPGPVLDWACGTGVAARAFLEHFGPDAAPAGLHLTDRSALAMKYAAEQVRAAHPGAHVHTGMPGAGGTGDIGTLLVSHVLTELPPAQRAALEALARRAAAVLWVEPGTHLASRALIDMRERLRAGFTILAPCTHQEVCGLLAPENARHWCHHFAESPQEVYIERDWARFGQLAGIDLRSLPLAHLVLDRRPGLLGPALAPPDVAVRVIGRPRMLKAMALVMGCDASGVREYRLMKRVLPEVFRAIKRDDLPTLQAWQRDGAEITALRPLVG